ncbi:MAG TPA: DNA primase [Candidatus Paceibacterota bacterium]|nr:DNA primase [Candidatus Paceibacterota bacterium]
MSDAVEQIKERLDIVDVISGYLKLSKSGANYKARCPFHQEKTPSFFVSPERQSWHCFGCNKGGDMFSFVTETEGIEFIEALRILAARANVVLPERTTGTGVAAKERQRLLEVAELSAKFFAKQLWHSNAGAKALAYLRERGMTDRTIESWRLGWAPNDWRALSTFLTGAGHADGDIVGAGMAIAKNGRIYDRFRSRIMFPICDANGQVVGFTGRMFGAEVTPEGEPLAKYVNTPQTAIYDKSRALFGLDKAKTAIRARDAVLLVEGNVDAIMSSQAGTAHVVATSGTALTHAQLRMLARYSTNLDVCFDEDAAGRTAARRGIGMALTQGFNVRVVSLDDPGSKDPADYVQRHGQAWNDVVGRAKPAMQYYCDQASAGLDAKSPQSKRAVIALMGPLVKRLVSKVEMDHWINQLAMLLNTDAPSVRADVQAAKDDIAAVESAPAEDGRLSSTTSPVPLDPLSQELLTLVVRAPKLAAQASAAAAYADPRVKSLIDEPERWNAADDPDRHLVDVAMIRADEFYARADDDELAVHLSMVSWRLQERDIRVRRSALLPQIIDAEQKHDAKRRDELVQTFDQFSQELNRLQTLQSPTSTP